MSKDRQDPQRKKGSWVPKAIVLFFVVGIAHLIYVMGSNMGHW